MRDDPTQTQINYADWFERQKPLDQIDILGPARYAAYKNGMAITLFVKDEKILSLEKLKIDRIKRNQIRNVLANTDGINPVSFRLLNNFELENEKIKRRLVEMQNSAVILLHERGEKDITITSNGSIISDNTSKTKRFVSVTLADIERMKQYQKRFLISIHTHDIG